MALHDITKSYCHLLKSVQIIDLTFITTLSKVECENLIQLICLHQLQSHEQIELKQFIIKS